MHQIWEAFHMHSSRIYKYVQSKLWSLVVEEKSQTTEISNSRNFLLEGRCLHLDSLWGPKLSINDSNGWLIYRLYANLRSYHELRKTILWLFNLNIFVCYNHNLTCGGIFWSGQLKVNDKAHKEIQLLTLILNE